GIGLLARVPYAKARVITLTAEMMLDLFEFRMALEGMACRLATERISPSELQELEEQLDAHRYDPHPGFHRFDFHARIVAASRNNRLIEALNQDTYLLMRLYRTSSGAIPERKQAAYEEHRQIIMAMKTGNADLSESLMRSHIGRAAQHIRDQSNKG
ncbi:MAG TPA: GntR family transcriptional regulator, partial [Bordetella sp.]|nr:GntR family transcriptional regulator [Bordetella sp.]